MWHFTLQQTPQKINNRNVMGNVKSMQLPKPVLFIMTVVT